MSTEPLGSNCNDISNKTQNFSFSEIYLKLSSGKCQPSCSGFIVLKERTTVGIILGMGSASERSCCYLTPSLIGQAHTQNDPCKGICYGLRISLCDSMRLFCVLKCSIRVMSDFYGINLVFHCIFSYFYVIFHIIITNINFFV